MKNVDPWGTDETTDRSDDPARKARAERARRLDLRDADTSHRSTQPHIDFREMTPRERIEAVAARLHELGGRDDRSGSRQEDFRTPSREDLRAPSRTELHARPLSGGYEDSMHGHSDTPGDLFKRVEEHISRASERGRGSSFADSPTPSSSSYPGQLFASPAAANLPSASSTSASATEKPLFNRRRNDKDRPAQSDTRQDPRVENSEGFPAFATRQTDLDRELLGLATDTTSPSPPRARPLNVPHPLQRNLAETEFDPRASSQARPLFQSNASTDWNHESLRRLEDKINALLTSSSLSPQPSKAPAGSGRPSAAEDINSAKPARGQEHETQDQETRPFRRLETGRTFSQKRRDSRDLDPELSILQRDIAHLNQKLEEIPLLGLAHDLNRLQAEIGVMSAELADLAPRGLATLVKPLGELDGLSREVRSFGDKLSGLGQASYDPDALAQLKEQTQEIHALLKAAAAHPLPIDQIEQKINALSQQIERQKTQAPAEGSLSVKFAQAQAAALNKIEERLEWLSTKLDRTIEDSTAHSRVNIETFEALLRSLADRFAAAQHTQADQKTLQVLQSQMTEMARYLERSDAAFSGLASLQRSVDELFATIEETRQRTQQVIQTSAETTAREVVREMMRQPGLAGAAAQPGLSRDIADLRSAQSETEQQTRSTLNAVHGTLEKIVDRLAMIEGEIAVQPERRLFDRPTSYDADFLAAIGDTRLRPSSDKTKRPAAAEPLGTDFLIEPRSEPRPAPAPVKNEAATRPEGKGPASRSDFIAAARRAAQAAQSDISHSSDAARPKLSAEDLKSHAARDGALAQTRSFLAERKRQLALALAALFLAVGAYAVTRTMDYADANLSSLTPQTVSKVSSTAPLPITSNAVALAAPQSTAPIAAADKLSETSQFTAPATASFPPPALQPQQNMLNGGDPLVVGSITAPKSAAPPADTQAAMAGLREHAESGNTIAQYDLASRYADGRGVARDLKVAANWYEKAAAHGLASAQYRLASLYEKGLGVTRDLVRARDLYEKAAAQGHIRAMHNLAVLTAEGPDGKPDYATASVWFRKAADYGIRDSQYNLGILFARGLGVSQDLVQSYTWFAVAAAQGDEDAGKKRDDVAAKLDAGSLVRAKTAADAFRPRIADRAVNEVQLPLGGWDLAPARPTGQKAKVSALWSE
jgi:localization factor PodJL